MNPFRYRSYYYDSETSLYYLNSRYYDPELGRFINVDDISILSQAKEFINGLNLYTYCNNNPIMNTDESGNAWWDWLFAAVVAVVVVVAVVAVTVVSGGVASTLLIGALVGGIVGGASSAITQLASGEDWSWGQFFLDVGFGAITGLIGGSSLGIIGSALAMGATSFIQSTTSDLVKGNSVNVGKAIINGFIGALLGAKAGAQNGLTANRKALQNSIRNVKSGIKTGAYSLKSGTSALNILNGYHLKKATNILKMDSMKRLIFNILASNIAQEKFLTIV